MSVAPGIQRRHSRRCPAHKSDDLEVCKCTPKYVVAVGWRGDRRHATFATLRDARRWRADMLARAEWRGKRRCPTVAEAADGWLEDIEAGRALSSRGALYRATTMSGYRRDLARFVAVIGDKRLDDITPGDLKEIAATMHARGLKPRTVKNAMNAIAALYGWARDHDYTRARPTQGVRVAGSSRSRRDRWADTEEALRLLEVLPERDRPLWATAFYAGLRRGELMALRWADVDLAGRRLQVHEAYDPTTRSFTTTKSLAGERVIPIGDTLAAHLSAHRLRVSGGDDDLVFSRAALGVKPRTSITRHGNGWRVQVWDRAHQRQVRRRFASWEGAVGWRDATRAALAAADPLDPSRVPFSDTAIAQRAAKAWRTAGLEPITLHGARHSFGSMLIAGGAAMAYVSVLMGHDSIQVTADVYVHTPDHALEHAIEQLDVYVRERRSAASAGSASPAASRALPFRRSGP